VVHRDRIYLFFDARYNTQRISTLIVRAHEFLRCARLAASNNLREPVIENLFAAGELAAKSLLLTNPDRHILNAKNSQVHSYDRQQTMMGWTPSFMAQHTRPGRRNHGYDYRG
jgi:hypothetical protein